MTDDYFNKRLSVAVIDTGVAPVDDLCVPNNRIVAFKDIINGRRQPYDDNGHGTHVSGIIAGNGMRSDGRYRGYAPECGIVGVKILDAKGRGSVGEVLSGLNWLLSVKDRYNIRVANLSIGSKDTGSSDPLVRMVEQLWDAGMVVVTAAGNLGPGQGTVTSPGVSRKVITVGSLDDQQRSGNGPTSECIQKPDILAPGTDIVSCLTNSEISSSRRNELKTVSPYYASMSGTSMAAPAVAGFAARMLMTNPNMAPDDVKCAIMRDASNGMFKPSIHPDGVYEVDSTCELRQRRRGNNLSDMLSYFSGGNNPLGRHSYFSGQRRRI